MTIPCQKTFGVAVRLIKFLSVLVVAGFLLAPASAKAQVSMTTIGNALNGSLPDIAALQAALGNPAAPYDAARFLDELRAAYGDGAAPLPATNSAAIFLSAGGGNVADMLSIQNTLNLPGIPAPLSGSGSAFFNNQFMYLDAYGFPVYPVGVINIYDTILDIAIVGTGNMGLATISAAIGGNAGAFGALSTLFEVYDFGNGVSTWNWSTMQQMFCNMLSIPPAAPTCATAQAVVDAAITGNLAAQAALNQFLASILQSNIPPPPLPPQNFLNGPSVVFLTGLGTPGGGGSNCLLDTDLDGIPDCNDPDIDNDGIPNQYDTDQNGDTIVDNPDTDGDGVPDVVDTTPGGGNGPPPTGGGGTGAGGGGGTGTADGGAPNNDCSSSVSAPLTGGFGADPCPLAEDTLQMVDADYWDVGGTQFVDRLNKLWTNEMLPSLKNMTAQWHASVIDQTRQFGSAVDAHDLSKQVKAVQTREVEAKKRAQPNERSCVGATPAVAMTMTASTSSVLAKGFQEDAVRRSGGAPGQPSAQGPLAVKNDKLSKYCIWFNNPAANAGANPCPPAQTAVAGPWPDGDIDVEGLLFKDTLHFNNIIDYTAFAGGPAFPGGIERQTELEAVKALMVNLIEPITPNRVTPDVESSQVAKEYILRLEQIESWRSIAHHVVAAMVSRRTSIPLPQMVTDSGGVQQQGPGAAGPAPPPPPPPPPPVPGAPQASRGTYNDFLRALGQREASGKLDVCNNIGYCGLYQMGHSALVEAGCIRNTGGQSKGTPQNKTQPTYSWLAGPQCPCGTSMTSFLGPGSLACQTSAVTEYHRKMWTYINAGARARACTLTTSPPSLQAGVWLTPSGLLAGAHLMGGGGVNCFVNGWGAAGCPGSVVSCPPGRPAGSVPCDANRTPITQYMNSKAGYDFPPAPLQCGPGVGSTVTATPYGSVSTGTPPPPPRPVGDTIREIRTRAGVSPLLISDNPSYNEIMLAMTKERFLDPDYYARMGNQIGALKQEQASVKAYISMQLQDIYVMQEQINLLLAARAAMRLSESGAGQQDRLESMPVAP